MEETDPQGTRNSRPKTAPDRGPRGWTWDRKGAWLTVRLPLPLAEMLASTAEAIEQMSRQVGLRIARAVLDDVVERKAGPPTPRLHRNRPLVENTGLPGSTRIRRRTTCPPGFSVQPGRRRMTTTSPRPRVRIHRGSHMTIPQIQHHLDTL